MYRKHFRIGGINIDNLPLTAQDETNEILFQAITNYELDITLMQETGINWSTVHKNNQWRERTNTWLDPAQVKTFMSYNKHDDNLDHGEARASLLTANFRTMDMVQDVTKAT